MKIRSGFILREVLGSPMVVATGDAARHFHKTANKYTVTYQLEATSETPEGYETVPTDDA